MLWIRVENLAWSVVLICPTVALTAIILSILHLPLFPGAILLAGCALAATSYMRLRTTALRHRALSSTFITLLLAVGIFAVTAFWVAGFHDFSADGQHYHLPAALEIASGWNPFWDAPLSDRGAYRWINSYPKATWFWGAVIYQATGAIEAVKVINLLMALSVMVLFWIALRKIRIQEPWAFLLSSSVAFSPVVITQLMTNYLDGLLGLTLLVLTLLVFEAFHSPSKANVLCFFLFSVFLLNLKFTAVIYFAVLGLAFVAASLFFMPGRSIRGTFWLIVMAGVFGVFVFGFNPYITNLYRHGHPLHPIMGRHKVDFIPWFSDISLQNQNRLRLFYLGYFSKVTNAGFQGEGKPSALERKLPLSIHQSELVPLTVPDTKVGGFGPLFSGILLLTTGLYFCLFFKSHCRRNLFISALSVVAIAASVLMNPALWWARYVPQLWFVPMIFILSACLDARPKVKLAASILLFLTCINCIIVATAFFVFQKDQEGHLAHQLREIKQVAKSTSLTLSFGSMPLFEKRLIAEAIPFERVESPTCPHPARLVGGGNHVQMCTRKNTSEIHLKLRTIDSFYSTLDPYKSLAKLLSIFGS